MANYVVVDKDQLEADLTTVADAIRSKGGTSASLAFPEGMKSAVEAIEAGIDTTSEVPAEATDIAGGKEAFVNGEIVRGALRQTYAGAYDWELLEVEGLYGVSLVQGTIELETSVTDDIIMRKGSYLGVRLPCSEFGDAKPEEVLSGKKFTSASGLQVEGNIPSIQEDTITPSTTAQEIPAGVYLAGKQTISAIQTETKTVTQNGTVTPSAGKYLSSVTVNVPTGTILPEDAIVVRVTKGASASTRVGSGYSLSVTYGNDVDIDDSLALAFVGTTQTLSNISATTDFSVLQGKYIRSGGSYGTTTGTFYYIPTGSTFTVSGSSMSKTLTCDKAQKVSIEKIDL